MRILQTFAATLALSTLFVFSSYSQEHEPVRKVLNKVAPTYPELARKMNIQGSVRLRVLVAPSGTTKSVEALGGSPLLVKAAQDAVYKWKWERVPEETNESIEFHFQPE